MAAIVCQNAHQTLAYWWREDIVIKPISRYGDYWEAMMIRGQWANLARMLRSHLYSFLASLLAFRKTSCDFFITTESQDLGLTSHPKDCSMQAAHTICTYAPPYQQSCCLLSWTLITRWKDSLLFSPEDTASVISNKKCTIWTRLTTEHFSTLKQST